MPKVSIREIDNTGAEQLEYLNYTVLIPGPKLGKLQQGSTIKCDPFEPSEPLTSTKELKDLVAIDSKNEKVSVAVEDELGFLMMRELLAKGLSVFYVPAYTLLDTEGGKTALPDFDLYDNSKDGFAKFSDRGRYDLRFITIGGLEDNQDRSYSKQALKCAAFRGDAVALLDIPADGNNNVMFYKPKNTDDFITIAAYNKLTPQEKLNYDACYGFELWKKIDERGAIEYSADTEKPVADGWFKIVLGLSEYLNASEDNQAIIIQRLKTDPAKIPLDTSDEMNDWVQETFGTYCTQTVTREGVSWTANNEKYGKYGAIFAPSFITRFVIKNNTEELEVPASFDYLACFAKYITNFKPWFAMSGSVRGVSPYTGIAPKKQFGDADVDLFQVRSGSENDGHIATNVICNIRPYGNIIWGNRTMFPLGKPENADAESAVQLTASNFLNIRQLCIDIKKTLYRAARRFTFEPNSDVLWVNFKGAITPLLEEMKANQGIKGYQIIKIKTNKKAVLVARIKIVPVEAVEDFDLTVELADSIEVTE